MGFFRQEYWSVLHSLLQGILLTQGSNPCLLHCRRILYHLNHQGSPTSSLIVLKYAKQASAPGPLLHSLFHLTLGCPSQLPRLWFFFFFWSLHSYDLSVPLSEILSLIILSCLQNFLSYYPPLVFFIVLITLWNFLLYFCISLLPTPQH